MKSMRNRRTSVFAVLTTLVAALVLSSCGGGSDSSSGDKTFKTGPITTTVKERFNVDPDKYLDHGSVVIAAITSCTRTSMHSHTGMTTSRPPRSVVLRNFMRGVLAPEWGVPMPW